MDEVMVVVRRILYVVLVFWTSLSSADGYQLYGFNVSESSEVRIGQLMKNPHEYVDKLVKVVGLVNDVCPMKGCWIEVIENQGNDRIRFKVQDDVVVFPVEAVGQEIIAEGILRRYEMSKEQATHWLAHLAEEKNEAFDASTVTGPMDFYQIEGKGAKIAL
jgi:hypothetical protein